uniref:Uncharacterized protein n=1 Tax=Biomphalaria glabrata TaxID=6526 RepID=A0A2C9LEM8_BIOGL
MDSSDSVIIDALLTESNTIAQEIENLDFSVRKLNSNEEKENATEDVSRALLLRESSMKNFNYSNQLIQDIAKLESRLNDLLNNTQGSTESTEAAQGIIEDFELFTWKI